MNDLSYHIANNPAVNFNKTLNVRYGYHRKLAGIFSSNPKATLSRLQNTTTTVERYQYLFIACPFSQYIVNTNRRQNKSRDRFQTCLCSVHRIPVFTRTRLFLNRKRILNQNFQIRCRQRTDRFGTCLYSLHLESYSLQYVFNRRRRNNTRNQIKAFVQLISIKT